ncbi:peptidoglycan recognition protein family protein [Saccharopolyspora rosea]|uniref:N-acetylmuramoyl-L-alanine amidase n=1 Tax=Saccharopolyspora rosea TaxID=524884 RepID=A0ABW3FWQ3_9PSEU|nr:N-acetylmuramoyl-L-alanine amidase [Saccharopolyspora rosea]
MDLPLVWLADVLRDAGLNVVETPGWRERTADSGPQPEPVGVLEHHTANTASYQNPAPSLQMCIEGRTDLAGPLCHGLIGFDGTVHLIAAGRANHAGRAKASGPNPEGDGNVLYVGFEWDYQGVDQGPSREQYSAALQATAAVLHHLGRPPDAARGHKETSVTGKIDPGHVDMDRFRADLGTKRQEEDMTPEQDAMLRRLESELLGPRGPHGEITGWNTELGPRTLVAMVVELVNGLLAQHKQQGAAAPQGAVPQQGLKPDPDTIRAAFQALPAEQAAPLLAELVRIQQARQPTPEQHAAQQR